MTTIDDGICSFQEIKNFYEKFIGIPADKLDKVAKEGYRAMTAVSLSTFSMIRHSQLRTQIGSKLFTVLT